MSSANTVYFFHITVTKGHQIVMFVISQRPTVLQKFLLEKVSFLFIFKTFPAEFMVLDTHRLANPYYTFVFYLLLSLRGKLSRIEM